MGNVSTIADTIGVFVGGEPRQLSVRETNPHTDPRWESFVMEHPGASIYHHPTWIAALEQEYPHPGVYLTCEDSDGRIVGLFPLMYTRGVPFKKGSPLAGPRLSSLPRTPLAGPLTLDPKATVLLLEEAVRRASSKPHVRLQIKAQAQELSGLVDGVVEKPWRFTYLLRLPDSSDVPFQISQSKNRSAVKRSVNSAVASGMRARLAETEDELAIWYRTYLESMRRNIVPARSYRFFLALWRLMRPKGLMELWLAEHQDGSKSTIVGGHIYFKLGLTLSYEFSGTLTNSLSLRPNDLLLWHVMNDAHRSGYRIVDFGEVPDGDENLVRFKTKWGAEPVRLYRYYYPDFPDSDHSSEGKESPLIGLAKAAWHYLPLGVTAWIGDQLYARL